MSGTKRKASSAPNWPSKVPKAASFSSPAQDERSKPAPPSQLRDEEPLFPRGGASALTHFEHKQIKAQATKDALFEDASASHEGKVEKKKQRKSVTKGKSHKDIAQKHDDHVKIEGLNHKRLVKGSLVLGQVSKVWQDGLVLSLPNNLVGHVSLSAISDSFYQLVESEATKQVDNDDNRHDAKESDPILSALQTMFHVGQFLRAHVLSTSDGSNFEKEKPRKRIELSIRPDQANTGLDPENVVPSVTLVASVVSAEDHGYVMDLGYGTKLRGFLLKREVSQQGDSHLSPGTVLLCLVTSKTGGNIVQLASRTDKFGKPRSTPTTAPTIDTFLPGTQAEVLIMSVSSGGLVGKILGSLDATADVIHSGSAAGVELAKKYPVGSKHKARVLSTFPAADNPKVGVSFLPQVMSLETTTLASKDGKPPAIMRVDQIPMSSIVEECTVRRVESGIGLFVDLGHGLSGFVHISRVTDGKVDSLYETSGPYKIGSVHRGRVLGYSAFDALFQITLEQSVIDQPYLGIDDVPVGEVVHGVVEKQLVLAEGLALIIKLADGIDGLVTSVHLSDVPLAHPEQKYPTGMKVKARVLWKDAASRRLRLTLKKTLVNSEDIPIQSYDQVRQGMRLNGTIVKFLASGAIIQFYGPLRGYLPNSEMSEAFISDPKSHFRVGQVLPLHVLEVHPDAQRFTVSCKDPSTVGPEKLAVLQALRVGQMVSAKVIQTTEHDVAVELSDSGLRAVLPVGHLSDRSAKKNRSALKRIRAGQTLTDLMVLEKKEGRRLLVTLTQKPSLIQAWKTGALLACFEDAQVGKVVPAVVKSITATAVFVGFAAGLSALLPKAHLPEVDRQAEKFGFDINQSVSVRIQSVDEKTRRIVVAIPSQGVVAAATPDIVPVVEPVDDKITTISDISIGSVVKVRVSSVKNTQVNVRVSKDIQGRIDVTQVFDSWSDIADPKHPLKAFKETDIHTVEVFGVHDARNHTFLPFSHRSGNKVLELSAKPSDVKNPSATRLDLTSVGVGSTWTAFVNKVSPICLWVTIAPGVRGRIDSLNLSEDLSQLKDLCSTYPVGSAIRVRVLSVDLKNKHLDLTARSLDSPKDISWDTVSANSILLGRIISAKERLVVRLSDDLVGFVERVDMADDYDEADPQKFKQNDIVRVAVMDVDRENHNIRLSLRPSKLLNSCPPIKDQEITDIKQISPRDIVRGFVNNISRQGLFVSLGANITGMVKISDLSDEFLKEWEQVFKRGQLVKARVLQVIAQEGHVRLSLRPSALDENEKPCITYGDIQEGQIVSGKIRKVESYGAFIVIDGSANVSGLCHKSEMADSEPDDARKLYYEGDVVKAVVLKIDQSAKRINFGLKPAYFEGDSDEEMHDEEPEDEDVQMNDANIDVMVGGTERLHMDMSEGEEDDSEDESEGHSEDDGKMTTGGLDAGGFDWNAQMDGSDVEGSDPEDEAATLPKKKNRKSKAVPEPAAADPDATGPQTAAEYDQAIITKPDDSYLWIQYMAFQLGNGELAKGREVAERAVASINPREQADRLAAWTAYMNAELEYGTEESLVDVFARACQDNDEQKVHESLIHIYIGTGRHDAADDLFQRLLKKFGAFTPDVWINYAQFLHATMSDPSRARDLLPRAIQRLGQESMVHLTSRFAAIEYRSPRGLAERGHTLFEGILTSFPKRMDIWNQFVDLEISAKGEKKSHVARSVFERGSQVQGLKPHAAKKWFKKWADWEESKGTDGAEGKARVMKKAAEWVKAATERKQAKAEDRD